MAYPPIEPYETGLMETDDGQLIYWETCGNPDGKPALVVHGGPGSGCTPGMRKAFDPLRYRIILFDQRGCGRSRPHASDPATDMSTNTTEHLIRDMEQLREHLGVDRWLLWGGSWGATLVLAYAERHPDRVSEIVLVSVTMSRRADIDWLYRGAGRFFPEAWARFRDAVDAVDYRLPTDSKPAIEGLLSAYAERMGDADRAVQEHAASEWCAWEDAPISMEANGSPGAYSARVDDARLAFVRICAHYFSHGVFLEEGAILRDAGRLAGIPGVLIHGRNDVGSPAVVAWELAQAWLDAELRIVEDSGHTGSTTMQAVMMSAVDRFART